MAENDVFSALNVGSGLNTTDLIKNLIEAERAPKEEKITKKIETAEVSISAIAELKSSISESTDTIEALDGTDVFTGSSTSTAVSLSVTDAAKVKQMMNTVSVSTLARGQTLVFDGFASETTSVGSGTIIFQRGTWSNGVFTADNKYNSKQVVIGDTSFTISDIKDAINSGNVGVSASVVKKTSTDYALALRAETGASNSFQISVLEGNNAGLKKIEHYANNANTSSISSASGATINTSAAHGFQVGDTLKYIAAGTALTGLTSLSSYKVSSVASTSSFTLTDTSGNAITYGGANGHASDKFLRTNKEAVAGQDASFAIDGVSITRSTNTISDVIEGATLKLSTVTTSDANISIAASSETVLEAINSLIDEVNTMSSDLKALLARGLNGEEKGALAGDSTIRAVAQKLKKITTEPIYGYGEKPIYLANLGVSTTQDGQLVLNQRTFDQAFLNNPQDMTALFNDRLHSSSSLVVPKLTGSNYEPGRYYFDIGEQGYLTGTTPSTDITSSNFTPGTGSKDLVLTVDGKQSGTISIGGGPYTTTSELASALETAINADNALAVAGIGVNVSYSSNKYIITSKSYGSKSAVTFNSIDNGLENYLGLQSSSATAGTGSDVGASLTDTPLKQYSGGFASTSGKASGINLKVTAPGKDAYIMIGNSFLSGLSDYLSDILKPSGVLTKRSDSLNVDLNEYNEDLIDLDEEIEKSRERYKEQYGEMEASVNTLKNTGEYLTNFMDAQNSE